MVTLTLALLCVWTLFLVLGRRSALVNTPIHSVPITLGFAAFAVVAVATSTNTVVDRLVYTQQMRLLSNDPTPWYSGQVEGDPLFTSFLWALSRLTEPSETVLFGTIAVLAAGACLIALRLVLPWWATLAAWVTLIATGLFTTYTSVAARQGLAVSLLLIAVALWATGRRRLVILAPLVAAASFLHWSAAALGVALACLYVFDPPLKWILRGWTVLAIAFVTGLNAMALDFIGLNLSAIDRYSAPNAFTSYGAAGNRLEFLAVSILFLGVGLWGRRHSPRDTTYRRILTAYVVFNALFLAFGFVAFSDRIASYSWFLAPMLLWRPLSNKEDPVSVALSSAAIVGVLGFALFHGTLAVI